MVALQQLRQYFKKPSLLFSLLRICIAAFICAAAFQSSVGQLFTIVSLSMLPGLLKGDRVVVSKMHYALRLPLSELFFSTPFTLFEIRNPERGDIIMFYRPTTSPHIYIKRIVGLEGDTVAMHHRTLYVNAVACEKAQEATPFWLDDLTKNDTHYHYKAHEQLDHSYWVLYTPQDHLMPDFSTVTVPKNHVFVLGDHRDQSEDSRMFGAVPVTHILGKLQAIAWSWDPRQKMLRWNRFFKSL